MSSHSDRFRARAGLFPQGLKFPGLQGLCMGGLDSSAYLSNAMGSPAVMVLSSTCGADVTPHSQSHMSFASRQGRTDSGKDGGGLTTGTGPFPNPSFPVRPPFGQTDPYTLSSPLLSLHHPLLASHAFRNSYLYSGAFRPLGLSDDRNGAFHGSAFVPAKCVKLDGSQGPGNDNMSGSQSLLLGPCYQSSESGFHQSPANSTGSSMGHGTGGNSGYLDGKEDRTDSDSIVDGPDRMSETPNLSEESRSIERSTPEERGTPKRHKKYFLDGQTPYCPICLTPVQSSELSAHYEFEVDKLLEMSKCMSQQLEASSIHPPFSSPMCMVRKDDKSKPESRWETYQRVKGNRTTRLTSARCMIKRKKWDDDRIPDDHLLPPALRKREGMEVDSAEASSIDSRADFNWAVTARLHAFASLQRALPVPDYGGRKFEVTEDENQELNVDGDDSATYGQPHYTEADIITCSTEDNSENKDQIRRIQSNDSNYQRHAESSQWTVNSGNNNGEGQEVTSTCVNNNDASECASPSDKASKQGKDSNGDSNKDHIEDGIKCLICMEPFIKPVVSICCWHVHCEECWLKTLGTKKLCPQCNMITSPRDLRRIFL